MLWPMEGLSMTRHTLEVSRTARYHLLGVRGPATRRVEFVLHGYGQLAAAFLASLAVRAGPERLLVAPEGLSRYYLRRGTGEVGASWMTKEERALEIQDTLRYLDHLARVLDLGGLELGLLGFSQGAAAAARWAVLGETRFTRVVLWGCPLPPDLGLEAHAERVRAMHWALVAGEHDATAEQAALERDAERLRDLGATVQRHSFSGGHELEPGLLARV